MTPECAGLMRAAHAAGFRVIPMGANKQPAIPWKGRGMAELDELERWAKADYDGYAVLCGGEQRLIVLDFEAGFDTRGFAELLRDADLYDVFEGWLQDYQVGTPGAGFHAAVMIDGSGPVPGNTKLAFDEEGKTTAETRGEGGLVVGPGSGGRVHPTRRYWILARGGFETIPLVPTELFDAVCEVVGKMSAAPLAPAGPTAQPAAPAAAPVGGVSLAELERSGSWIDVALGSAPTLEQALTYYRYVPDRLHENWTRPGKDPRLGTSCTVNEAGRLIMWSSNDKIPHSGSNPVTTYDVIDVIAYNEGQTRVDVLRRWKPAWTAPTSSAPADMYLPDGFWSATPWLTGLRDAALSRMIAPETVLGAFLSAYSATIPMAIWLPSIVVAEAPLNYYTCLVGPSGSGKSGSATIASQLLGFNRTMFPNVLLNQGLRSGEGLVTLAVIPSKTSRDGVDLGPSYRNGIQVCFDEGEGAARQAERLGSSTLSYLCSAWSGPKTMIGGAKANGIEGFPADLVRISMQMGTQPGVAGALFVGAAAAQGFPQRFVYFATDNPIIGELPVDATPHQRLSPLDIAMWPHNQHGATITEITFPDHIWREVRQRHRDRVMEDPLDGHHSNLNMRTAALFALADGEKGVTDQHWNLALQLTRASRTVRRHLVNSIGNLKYEGARAAGELDAIRNEGRDTRWARGKAERIANWIHTNQPPETGYTRKQLKERLSGGEKKRLDEVLEVARAYSWVIHRDGHYFAGPSRPSS